MIECVGRRIRVKYLQANLALNSQCAVHRERAKTSVKTDAATMCYMAKRSAPIKLLQRTIYERIIKP